MTNMKQPDLGRKIFEIRKLKGLTQEELVQRCNINVRTLQRIEAGEVMPRTYTLKVIFDVLEYDMCLLNKSSDVISNQRSFSKIRKWYTHGRHHLNLLFDLKVNTMKKVSVLSILVITSIIFIIGSGMSRNRNKLTNKLIGEYKLVSMWDHGKMRDVQIPRFLKFTDDQEFVTSLNNGNRYNSGSYYAITDSTFITIHDLCDGTLAESANKYNYSIAEDTLKFNGFYMLPISVDEYRKEYIDEIWVRIK